VPGLDREGKVVHGDLGAEALGQVAYLDQAARLLIVAAAPLARPSSLPAALQL